MKTFNFPIKKNISIFALGAESAGNFSIFKNGKICLSPDFGNLLEEKNWKKYQKIALKCLKYNKIKPQIILTDLHPYFKTTFWGQELAKKYKAKFIQVQHHYAHIFSAIGDKIIKDTKYKMPACQIDKLNKTYGVAMDGTGYGIDKKIWGGEIFENLLYLKTQSWKIPKLNLEKIKRIGHLENQIMIGGDLAIKEPARMLISILNKFLDKEKIYSFVKKYYTKNQFEFLHNQLSQNFNCFETSSTGRILDAVSILLGFCDNIRKYKHEPINLLEKNSTIPYFNLKPKIIFDKEEKKHILLTTPLLEYLIKNIKKDKKRLAATAQLYIAEGLYEIIKKQKKQKKKKEIFIAGGIANNKIIAKYLISKGAYDGKLISRGDAGISFGQILYYLSSVINIKN